MNHESQKYSKLFEDSINQLEEFSVRHQIVEYPAFADAFKKIESVHRRWRIAKVATGVIITGQSGSGKTTVLESYCNRFPRYEEPERSVTPVLMVITPANPTVKNLAEAILVALGDGYVNKGSAEEKTRRIYRHLVTCQVELLIIDEFHHFFDSRIGSEARKVTDWLKNLLNQAQIPVIVVGLPRAAMVIRMNEQLARRFSSALYLRPFSFDTDERRREFRAVLKIIHSRLPIACPDLHEINMARRLYIGSNGLIDYVAKIIDEAVMLVSRDARPYIDLDVLATAFEESVWRDAPEVLNPFRSQSVLRQLDRIGEPFEHWDEPKKNEK